MEAGGRGILDQAGPDGWGAQAAMEGRFHLKVAGSISRSPALQSPQWSTTATGCAADWPPGQVVALEQTATKQAPQAAGCCPRLTAAKCVCGNRTGVDAAWSG